MKTAKANVSEEYARSLVDLMVIKSRPRLPMVRSYIVSDLTSVRSRDVNFGWGKAVYGGLAKVFPEPNKKPINFYIPLKNRGQWDPGASLLAKPSHGKVLEGAALHVKSSIR